MYVVQERVMCVGERLLVAVVKGLLRSIRSSSSRKLGYSLTNLVLYCQFHGKTFREKLDAYFIAQYYYCMRNNGKWFGEQIPKICPSSS